MTQQDESTALPGRSIPVERHDAGDVELSPAGAEPGTELGAGGRESAGAADATVEVEAADAVEDYVKEKASDKAAGAVEREARELVDTPGNVQVLTTLWIFLLQKFALLLHVAIRWPGWFLQLIAILTIFTLDLPSVGLGVPESTWIMCVAISHILLAPSLIARSGFLVKFWRDNEDAPRYGTRREIGRAVAVGICLPSLLSAFFILIGEDVRREVVDGIGCCALLACHRLHCRHTCVARPSLEVVRSQVLSRSERRQRVLEAKLPNRTFIPPLCVLFGVSDRHQRTSGSRVARRRWQCGRAVVVQQSHQCDNHRAASDGWTARSVSRSSVEFVSSSM